jgi:hypothetical protein
MKILFLQLWHESSGGHAILLENWLSHTKVVDKPLDDELEPYLAVRRSLSYTCRAWKFGEWVIWSSDTSRLLSVTCRSETNGSRTFCIRHSTYLFTGYHAMRRMRVNFGSSFICTYWDAQGNVENSTNVLVVCLCTCRYLRHHSNAEFVANVDTEICFGVETLRRVVFWSQLIRITDKTRKKLWFLD